MTDNDALKSDPFIDPTSWLAHDNEYEKLSESIRPVNKTTLFDVLGQTGIATVLVQFDGYGDSGQIEDISAHANPDTAVNLPEGNIEIARIQWGDRDIRRQTLSVRDAIEQLAYDLLEETHGGWENNEGAYGDFLFDVPSRTITLNYNERVETSEYTQHVF